MAPSRRTSMSVGAACALGGLSAVVLAAATLMAQESEPGPPAPAMDTRAAVAAIVEPVERVALQAQQGDWQAADAAFNAILDTLDAHRPALESALGDSARLSFARCDALLVDLASALDAEDLARVRAVVALVVSELLSMEPGAVGAAGTDGTLLALEWHARVEAILALAEASAWRDMRNEAMALTDDIARRGPAVALAAGGEASRHVNVARVFAMRLRSAALSQSRSEARDAAAFLTEALDALLQPQGDAPRPRDSAARRGVGARAFQVDALPGEVVIVPITLEGVPQIGLGSVRLLAGWSPGALRLVDVAWDAVEGSVVRYDAAGRVEMDVPPAPIGPSGDVVLGRLVFEVLGGRVDPRDYLPSEELAAIEAGAADARVLTTQGDTPRASDALARAYAVLMKGRDRNGSLYEALHRAGLAAPLAETLLSTLDLVTQPADTDRVFLALRELDERLAATLSAHLAALGGAQGVPVQVDATSMTDTAGTELPIADSVPGLVRLPAGMLDVASSRGGVAEVGRWPGAPAATAVGGTAPARPTPAGAPEPLEPRAEGPVADGGNADRADRGAPAGGFPLPLVIALIVAACAGVLAVLWSERRGRPAEDGRAPMDW